MKYNLRGVDYEVKVAGSGEPLLLIHGFSGSCRQWEPFVESWSAQYQLIMVDMLGHGGSDAPKQAERYGTEEVAQDLAVLLHHLRLEKVHLLGYSMGGRIALSFTMQYPQLIHSLVLESSSPGLEHEEERQARRASDQALAARIEQQGIDWFADYWGAIPLFESLRRLPKHTQDRLDQARRRNNPWGLAQSLRGIGTGQQPSWWHRLGDLHIPALLIAGELDHKYCSIAQRMKRKLTDAQLEIVPQAGHNVHVEQPVLFDTIVKRFLDQRRMV